MNAYEYVLAGSTGSYLQKSGSKLLDRLQSHTDWWNARYEFGVDPYSKSTTGPIHTECEALDRNGRNIRGINLASQDYLSLANHPAIKTAAIDAANAYGVHSAGSPALMGNTRVSIELERRLADFVQMRDCVVYPTGWAAAYGIIKALVGPEDHVVIDILSHASLMEGARNATRNIHVYPHLSISGLERRLRHIRSEDTTGGILVVTESLFSMDSDTPDLEAHQELSSKYDATLLVDAAHDLGAIGPTGRGHLEVQKMLGKVDLLMGSFSKTFASNGGFVATNHPALKLALRYGSCPQTFSNAISPIQASIVLKAIDIIESTEGMYLRRKLSSNSDLLRRMLIGGGYRVLGATSAIVPVILGDAGRSRIITKFCLERGSLVNLVEYPAVAKNSCRFRLQLMANHTATQLESFINILQTAACDADKYLSKLMIQS